MNRSYRMRLLSRVIGEPCRSFHCAKTNSCKAQGIHRKHWASITNAGWQLSNKRAVIWSVSCAKDPTHLTSQAFYALFATLSANWSIKWSSRSQMTVFAVKAAFSRIFKCSTASSSFQKRAMIPYALVVIILSLKSYYIDSWPMNSMSS